MTTSPLSLCRRLRVRRGPWPRAAWAAGFGLAVACMGLGISVSGAAFGQLPDWTTDKGLRLDPLLERVVESKGPDGAVRFDLAPAVAGTNGEQFVLTLRFTNTTGATVDDVRITSVIPAGLRYIAGSATGPGGLVLFSTDGGHTFGNEQELAARGAASESGGGQTNYTHVRWVLAAPLEVGATGFVRLRVLAR